MKNIFGLMLTSIVNGMTGEGEINTRRAADKRHPEFITTFELPAEHATWPEGTIMVQAMNGTDPIPGQATALASNATSNIIGVLNERVEANATSGNVMIHGSCAPDILVYVPSTGPTAATAAQIAVLRQPVGIYV